MRISDWSSDVCSSDLQAAHGVADQHRLLRQAGDLLLEEAAVIGELLVVQLGMRRLAGEAAAVEGQVGRMGAPAAAAELGAQRLEHPAADEGTVQQDDVAAAHAYVRTRRSEEHTSELQSLMRIPYAVFCL